MSVDLTSFVNDIIAAPDTASKILAFKKMVNGSRAKAATKALFLNKVQYGQLSSRQLDKLAYDYMLSGEGNKVLR